MKLFLSHILLFLSASVLSQEKFTEPDTATVLTNHFKLTDKTVKAGQCYQLYDVDFHTNTNDLNLTTPCGLDSLIEFIKKTKINYLFILVSQEKKFSGKIEENLGWERAKAIQKYMKRKGVKESTTLHIKAMCTAKNYEDIKNKVKKTDTPTTINILQKKPVSFYVMQP